MKNTTGNPTDNGMKANNSGADGEKDRRGGEGEMSTPRSAQENHDAKRAEGKKAWQEDEKLKRADRVEIIDLDPSQNRCKRRRSNGHKRGNENG
jgi:hypothetical protein